jgi:hypothetical protein
MDRFTHPAPIRGATPPLDGGPVGALFGIRGACCGHDAAMWNAFNSGARLGVRSVLAGASALDGSSGLLGLVVSFGGFRCNERRLDVDRHAARAVLTALLQRPTELLI